MLSIAVDPSPAVKTGSIPLQPTAKAEFRLYHGQKSAIQKLLGNLGRQMDNAKGQDMPGVTPRYQPHNCLPWRSDNCVCVYQPAPIINQLAPTIRPPTIQSPPFNPGTSGSGNLANRTLRPIQWQSVTPGLPPPRGLPPTIPPTQQWQSFIPGASAIGNPSPTATYRAEQWQPMNSGPPSARKCVPTAPPAIREQFLPDTSSMGNLVTDASYRAVQKQPVNPSASAPRTVEAVVKSIHHMLLHYFCEGGGEAANEKQRRDHVVGVLKKEFQACVLLSATHVNTEHCEEFSRIEQAVEGCLQIMNVPGLTLVPELSDDGRELIIHVFS
jgi:hypothetical protein